MSHGEIFVLHDCCMMQTIVCSSPYLLLGCDDMRMPDVLRQAKICCFDHGFDLVCAVLILCIASSDVLLAVQYVAFYCLTMYYTCMC